MKPHATHLSSRILRILALGLTLGFTPTLAVGTPAGTTISNTADVSFDAPASGTAGQIISNTVSAVVQSVCALSITPNGTPAAPGQAVTVLPGEAATFRYALVNAGNDTATLDVTAQGAGGAFTPAMRVHHDLNSNGFLDAGEPEVTAVTLPADGTAQLLLIAQTTGTARGDAAVNLVAGCPGGVQDVDNVSRVTVGPPPALAVNKTFSPALVRPGAETTVTVTTTNGGQGESREVLLTDLLSAQRAQGLKFVPGSAAVSGVGGATIEYSDDGVQWSATEPLQVSGVRVRAAALPSGGQLTLTFRMLAEAQAENKQFTNVAVASTGSQSTSGTAVADVRYQPAVAIGPPGTPEAAEGTPDDRQVKTFGVVGQATCFDHTLKNTGDVRDAYRVTVATLQGEAAAELLTAQGTPLALPLPLEPGESVTVRVCHAAAQAGTLETRVTATGERGTTNVTFDQVQSVEAGLPEVRKATSVPAGVPVAQGDFVTYTLSVRNPYTRSLTGLTVTDPLPAHVDFVDGSDGVSVTGQPGSQSVTWTFGTLNPGDTRVVTVRTKVSERAADGEQLTNVFTLTSTELPTPVPSNEVSTPVWSASLIVIKEASARTVTYGDRVRYTLRIRNLAPTTALVNAVVTDEPAVGLEYVPGTATLNGEPLADPNGTDRQLRWLIGTLPPGAEVVLTYVTRVTPAAGATIVNTVQVVGATGQSAGALAIASNRATASIRLEPLHLAPIGDVIGVVFVDRDGDGVYDAGTDTPVQRARIIMAGGRIALTDQDGRYHFANVPFGTQALRLDPGSTPYAPAHLPASSGLPGTQTVHVRGLTSADFPLTALPADVTALRRTVLTVGDVRIEKVVVRSGTGYVVTLTITSARPIDGFTLLDPLPDGAVLKDGRNGLTGTLATGMTTITYRFDGVTEDRAATTDPAVSWRN